MANYAKVINNEIVEYNRTLPFSTENTSFGVGTDAETLKSYGYLPIVGSEPEYDRLTHRIGNVSYAVGTDEVVKTYEVVELTVEEIRERDVPTTITPLQAKLQLHRVGLLDEVEAMVATDVEVRLYWEYALEIRRDHPTLLTMATALGLSDEQLDMMFIEAGKIQ